MAELYFSATSVSRMAAYAYVLPEDTDKGVIKGTRIVAEYKALVRGLERALYNDKVKLTVFGPKLVIDQLNGMAPVKSSKARLLHKEAKDLLSSFRKVELNSISLERNRAFPISIQALAEFVEGKEVTESKKISDKQIRRIKGLKFYVQGYAVDLGKEMCECPFFVKTNTLDVKRAGIVVRCRHIFAAERYISR